MTDRTASQNTLAFRDLPADIQAASLDAVGHLPRPMSHMEMLLAVGQAVLAERKRCAEAYMHWARKMMEEVEKE